ncbi:flavodoxin [Fusobacterium simiae]|uniref:flavodoxin n=1 Tax=Fusobacterium TaxID=848 RepID=UPI00040023DF|nr:MULTISPECIES: flavodoxin [Fusobacterium]MDC7954931.1 flavodoxin [Fusobacterium simiae]
MKKMYILLTVFLLSIIASVTAFGADKKILIAYFSKAGENYGVGTVEKGNTQILAEMIAKETGGDLFKIEPVKDYPTAYDDVVKEAKQEKDSNARPKIKNKVNNLKDYDIVFLGYPIWYGDMPMPVYTFLDENNLSGKTIIPFSTNEGSGISGTVDSIEKYTKGNVIKNAFSTRGRDTQNSQNKVAADVKKWIETLKANKNI